MKKLLLCVLLLCSVLLLSGCDDNEYTEDGQILKYTVWSISEDGNYLSDGTNTFLRYGYLPLDADLRNNYHYYSNNVTYNDESYEIYGGKRDSGILYLYNYSAGYIAYVKSESDKDSLDKFLSGNTTVYRIEDYDNLTTATIEKAFADELDKLSDEPISVNVRDLKVARRYLLYFYNSEDTLKLTHGAIYSYEGSYYYVNYDKLDNHYFDATGSLSYRRGTVEMYKLTDELEEKFDSYIYEMDDYELPMTTEYDDLSSDPTEDDAKRTIVAVTLILGAVLPLLPLAIGVIGIIKRRKKEDFITACILVAASAVWLISGIIILILSL